MVSTLVLLLAPLAMALPRPEPIAKPQGFGFNLGPVSGSIGPGGVCGGLFGASGCIGAGGACGRSFIGSVCIGAPAPQPAPYYQPQPAPYGYGYGYPYRRDSAEEVQAEQFEAPSNATLV